MADPADDSISAEAAAFAAARALVRRAAPDFHFASFFLPRPKRDAACAAAAFCHLIREAVLQSDTPQDETAPAGGGSCCSTTPAEQRVAKVRERIEQVYSGSVELPMSQFRDESQHVLHAFSLVVPRYEVLKEHLYELVEGCRADLTVSRYATWASLERYCRGAGGAVARVLGSILGLTHSDAGDRMDDLGCATRLAAILRDLGADVGRGRIYLPLEDLVRFRCSERDLLERRGDGRVRDLVRHEADRMCDLLRRGSDVLPWLAGDGSRLAAANVVCACDDLLGAIRRRGDPFAPVSSGGLVRRLRRVPAALRLVRQAEVRSDAAPAERHSGEESSPAGGGGASSGTSVRR